MPPAKPRKRKPVRRAANPLAPLLRMQRPTCRLELTPDSGGPSRGTRLGGVPWWPPTVERPRCPRGHLMAFIGQFALADLPSGAKDAGVLSFHYCQECAHAGEMSFGHGDAHRAYDVRRLARLPARPDGRGSVAPSPIPPYSVQLSEVKEIPSDEDLEPALLARLPEPEYDSDEHSWGGLPHVQRSKLGGWPHWQQTAAWPECPDGRQMAFIAQLDSVVGQDAAWGGGGHAYLFVCPPQCRKRHGELVIQTT